MGVLSTAAGVFAYSITINIVYYFGAMVWGHLAWRSARQSEEIAGQAERERVSQERGRDIALGLGMSIAGSVTQEKESRVVEILAAAVPIRQLL